MQTWIMRLATFILCSSSISHAATRRPRQDRTVGGSELFRNQIPGTILAKCIWQNRLNRHHVSLRGVPKGRLNNRVTFGLYRYNGKRLRGPRVGLSMTFLTSDAREHDALFGLVEELSRDMDGNTLFFGRQFDEREGEGELTIGFPICNVPLSPTYRYGVQIATALLADEETSDAGAMNKIRPEVRRFVQRVRDLFAGEIPEPPASSARPSRLRGAGLTCGSDLSIVMY